MDTDPLNFLIIAFIVAFLIVIGFYFNKLVGEKLSQQKLLKAISLTMPDLIYVLNFKTKDVIYVNKSIYTWLNLSFDPNVNYDFKTWLEQFVFQEDLPRIEVYLEMLKNSDYNQVNAIEYRLRNKEGGYYWVMDRTMVFERNSKGEVLKVLGCVQNITERKLAFEKVEKQNNELKEIQGTLERKLTETERLNSQLSKAQTMLMEAERLAKLGSYEWSIKDNVSTWTDQIYRNFGLEPGEIEPCYENYIKFVHPEDVPILESAIQKALQSPSYYTAEFRIINKKNEILYLFANGEVILDESGQPVKIIGSNLDVTERKKAELANLQLLKESQELNERLAESERRLKDTLENVSKLNNELKLKEEWLAESQKIAKIGSWQYDLEDNSIAWSDELFEIYGVEKEKGNPTFEQFLALVHPEDRQQILKNLENDLLQATSSKMEMRLVYPSGHIRWVLCIGKPYVNEKGKIAKYRGIVYDINERKQMEISLRKSEEFFRALIQNSSDHVITIEPDGNTIYYSPSFYRYTGYMPEERVGKSALDCLIQEDKSILVDAIHSILDNPDNMPTIEFRAIHKSQKVIWFEGTLTNMLDKAEVKGIVINCREISQRKMVDDQLKQHNEELKKINSELDSFVYRASHDIRAPLSSLLGLINITQEERDEKLKSHYYHLMHKSVERLDLFIKSIIDYSRNSRLEVQAEQVNFRDLIEEVFDEHKYMERSGDVVHQIQIDQEASFFSDLFRLKIIFNNIISNAIKYSNPRVQSYIRIQVKAGKTKALIVIADNGRGISEESVGKIFQMFYRASDHNVGSGLGLYIVKEAVQALKGEIQVKSQLGKGTEFIIEIPNLNKENRAAA